VSCALGRDPAILGQVPADRIAELGALLHGKVARAELQRGRLLLLSLYRHAPHARPLRRFADRFRIDRIVLVPIYIGLHVRWRNEPNFVTYSLKFSRLVMRTTTLLQRHQAPRVGSEKVEQLASREPATEHRSTSSISSVRVENLLGDIQPDRGSL
jgi:hypothetical protein